MTEVPRFTQLEAGILSHVDFKNQALVDPGLSLTSQSARNLAEISFPVATVFSFYNIVDSMN